MNIQTLFSIALIIFGALIAQAVFHTLISKYVSRKREANIHLRGIALFLDRLSSLFFAGIALAMILDELGVDTKPFIAGVGIVGLFVTLGAQTLLKDVFSGFFIFFEDLYGEGDKVSLDEISGTVAKLTLRKTVLRDAHGHMHHIPHGSVKIITVSPHSIRGSTESSTPLT